VRLEQVRPAACRNSWHGAVRQLLAVTPEPERPTVANPLDALRARMAAAAAADAEAWEAARERAAAADQAVRDQDARTWTAVAADPLGEHGRGLLASTLGHQIRLQPRARELRPTRRRTRSSRRARVTRAGPSDDPEPSSTGPVARRTGGRVSVFSHGGTA
jgi:IS5 family transposase